MTTADLLNTIAQGAPITARLEREIVTHLHRLRETEAAQVAAESRAVGATGGRPQCGRPHQPTEPRP